MYFNKYLSFVLFVTVFSSCGKKTFESMPSAALFKRKYALLTIDKFNALSPKIFNASDTIYVVNFWATSCPPCIVEMPHFNALEINIQHKPVKIYLVSLDLIKDTETRVKPFIAKHHVLPQVIHLKDDFYSKWVDKIDPSWYGALPATLIIKGSNRKFTFGAFDRYEDLLQAVESVGKI
jgi:thiol-disulfide isomerase/thioredoxin